MGVKHEAFLDLEDGLTGNLLPAWESQWKTVGAAIVKAGDAGEWDRAHALVSEIDLAKALSKKTRLLETMGMAAVYLGVSRLVKPEKSHLMDEPPHEWLAHGVRQSQEVFAEFTTALRTRARDILDQHEYAASSGNSATLDDVVKANVRRQTKLAVALRPVIANHGRQGITLAANLQTSRLASLGYLMEATFIGLDEYQINEVLDPRTCKVCEKMHGMRFSVPAGLSHISRTLQASGGASLRAVAPWVPRQGPGFTAFQNMDAQSLMASGYGLPPFHPHCRGIITKVSGASAGRATGAGLGAAAASGGLITDGGDSGTSGELSLGITEEVWESMDERDRSLFWLGLAAGSGVALTDD